MCRHYSSVPSASAFGWRPHVLHLVQLALFPHYCHLVYVCGRKFMSRCFIHRSNGDGDMVVVSHLVMNVIAITAHRLTDFERNEGCRKKNIKERWLSGEQQRRKSFSTLLLLQKRSDKSTATHRAHIVQVCLRVYVMHNEQLTNGWITIEWTSRFFEWKLSPLHTTFCRIDVPSRFILHKFQTKTFHTHNARVHIG